MRGPNLIPFSWSPEESKVLQVEPHEALKPISPAPSLAALLEDITNFIATLGILLNSELETAATKS